MGNRKASNGTQTLVNKFLTTPYDHEDGKSGKTYTLNFSGCKILMDIRPRAIFPTIELIKFSSGFLLINKSSNFAGIKYPGNHCHYELGDGIFDKFLKTSHEIHRSKVLERDSNNNVLALVGIEKLFFINLEPSPLSSYQKMENIKEGFSPHFSDKKKFYIKIKNEKITNIKEAIDYYLDKPLYIFGESIIIPSREEEIPKLEDHFTREELAVWENPTNKWTKEFLEEEMYHRQFSFPKSQEYIAQEQANDFMTKVREKMVNYLFNNLYIRHPIQWNPGCKCISISNDNISYIRGPWDAAPGGISTNNKEDFKKSVSHQWHTVYKLY